MQRFQRTFRLGLWKYHKGSDLMGNNYFEIPDPNRPETLRRTVRQPGVSNPQDYIALHVPPLWSAWMRCTRKDPPTHEEQLADAQRQASLAKNVARLAEEYKAEKLRMAEKAKNAPAVEAVKAEPAQKPAIGPEHTPRSSEERSKAEGELARARQHMRRSPLEDYKPAALGGGMDEPEAWQPRIARR